MARIGGPGVVALGAAILVAACSGAPGGPGATPGGPGPTGPGSATDPPAPTSGSVGGAFDACTLLTGDEAGGALHVAALTSTSTPGDPAKCSYALPDGEEVLTIDVVGQGAAAQFQAFIDNGSAEAVAGVGDQALFEPSSQRLVFLVSDRMVYVHSRYLGGPGVLETLTGIGVIAAARASGGPVPPGVTATPPPIASAQGACDLISPEEAASVLGKGPMSSTDNGAPQFCTFSVVASGEVLMSTYLQRSGGSETWASFMDSLETEPVDGLGEKARFEPSTGILFVLQGDSIMNVNVYSANPNKVLDLDRQLAEIMLTHL